MKKSYLKPESGVWFYLQYMVFFYNGYDRNGRKKPEKYIYTKNKEKFPVWFPSHPPVYKIGGRLFSGSKKPETSRTYPRWDGNPNLQGEKK